jgi:hypothetical protein
MKFIKYNQVYILILLLVYAGHLKAQNEKDSITDWDRTFMPAFQLGFVTHGSDQLTGGLMIQTSIEYRHESNFVLRLNYDDFNSQINLAYPINPNLTYTGRMSFFEVIGGIGYRDPDGKHNLTAYIQGGIRNYGAPIFSADSLEANIDFDTRNIGVMRYTLGYEFTLTPKLFLSIETLLSHTFQSKDYWSNNRLSYGFTVGLSAPLN